MILLNSMQSIRNTLTSTLQPGKCKTSSVFTLLKLAFTAHSYSVFILFLFSTAIIQFSSCFCVGCVSRCLYLLASCCRWTVSSMTGPSPWQRAASIREKLCMSRACPTGPQPTSDPTARPSE